MKTKTRNQLLLAGGAAGVLTLLIIAVTRTKTSASGQTPGAPPERLPPGGSTGSGIPVGKPGVTVGPGPFDPVSTEWKRKNAPSWWPW